MGRPLAPAVCGIAAAEAEVEGWASSKGDSGAVVTKPEERPWLAEGLLLRRLEGRSELRPVRRDEGGDWAGEF